LFAIIKLMIRNPQNQYGSAHVVVIIILVIAVLGLVGFVFWQNFIHKESMTKQSNGSNLFQDVDTKVDVPSIKVDENEYSFTVVEGFSESTTQQFTYTGSLKAVKTFVDKNGDYFEVLSTDGGGGGISGDYFWGYEVQNDMVVLDKKPRCAEDSAFCFANNGSVEGIISNKPDMYYFAFGNKTKNEINTDYVDKFISTFKFK
jgi:hypothetical protein